MSKKSRPWIYPESLVAYVLFQRRAGNTYESIARELGITPSVVGKWCTDHGVRPAQPPMKPCAVAEPANPQLFKTITVDDWKRNLRMARERCKGAQDRMAAQIIASLGVQL